tara:strand:+ start:295 stop:399 length:105 start_codon:yes stop_codon:yes gene_type:complete
MKEKFGEEEEKAGVGINVDNTDEEADPVINFKND